MHPQVLLGLFLALVCAAGASISGGLLGVLGPWTLFGILCGLGAFYASARSLQIGDAVGVREDEEERQEDQQDDSEAGTEPRQEPLRRPTGGGALVAERA